MATTYNTGQEKGEGRKQPTPSISFESFVNTFKKMLVCRYNWEVSAANDFTHIELINAFNDGLNRHQTYSKVFKKEPDLVPS